MLDLRELNKISRASICLIAPLTIMMKKNIKFSNPGGCKFGIRNIDLHLKLIERFAQISYKKDYYETKFLNIPDNFEFNCSTIYGSSVGVTFSCILVSLLLNNKCNFYNISKESIILNTIKCLLEYKIISSKIIERNLEIKFNCVQQPLTFNIDNDINEAVSYILFAYSNRQNITLKNFSYSIFSSYYCNFFDDLGIEFSSTGNDLFVITNSAILKSMFFECSLYPKLSTDLAPIITVATLSRCSNYRQKVFLYDSVHSDRSAHIKDISSLGIDISISGHKIEAKWDEHKIELDEYKATDIRGGFALLCALSLTKIKENVLIKDFYQIERGYPNLVNNLSSLGVYVREVKNE